MKRTITKEQIDYLRRWHTPSDEELDEAPENEVYLSLCDLAEERLIAREAANGGMSKQEFVQACIENHAQLIRFVVRDKMLGDRAAAMAIDHAEVLWRALKAAAEKGKAVQ